MDKEKRKRLGLAGLLVVLIGVLIWQFVLADDSGEPATAASGPVAGQRGPKPSKAVADENGEGYRPLPLAALERGRSSASEPTRNIFTYYVPPPKPYVPPPPPPTPLKITSISPASVYAGTVDTPLQVTGTELPPDCRIYVNGQSLPSTVKEGAEVTATIPKSLMTSPSQLQVEVRDDGGGLYSNKLTLLVNPAPPPPYRYVGRIDNLAFLSGGGGPPDERFPLLLGTVIDKRWKLISIGDEQLMMEDTLLQVQHPVRLSPEGSTASLNTPPEPVPPQQQMRDVRRQLMRQRGIEAAEEDEDSDHKDPDRP
ncbi:MAG: IPT/TIG domain-containing protein [Acidobacteria bacterium]|nr:IPT/TIG domain-containing protein [Acidobacteriota bacterium]